MVVLMQCLKMEEMFAQFDATTWIILGRFWQCIYRIWPQPESPLEEKVHDSDGQCQKVLQAL